MLAPGAGQVWDLRSDPQSPEPNGPRSRSRRSPNHEASTQARHACPWNEGRNVLGNAIADRRILHRLGRVQVGVSRTHRRNPRPGGCRDPAGRSCVRRATMPHRRSPVPHRCTWPRCVGPSREPLHESGVTSNLDSPQRWPRLRNHDGRPGVASEVSDLHVLCRDPHVEPTISPLVPDGREEDGPVPTQGRQDRHTRLVEEPAQAPGRQVSPHAEQPQSCGRQHRSLACSRGLSVRDQVVVRASAS
jgi:hypothetical protein